MLRVRSSQKLFTEAEVVNLTGICREHLRRLANEKHLGTMATALIAGERAESWLFSNSDLMILSRLHTPCAH
ncbi:MAG TPA: hypothetical protein VMB47_17730 [Candidatus Aquilonibacter sp.]|nr:hypothetical protein [Candidatus Aquilonibacter sp.]